MSDRWWQKNATIPGEYATPHQRHLSKIENYSGLYKRRFFEEFGKKEGAVSGDYCSTPRRASVMLMNHTYSELTIPKQSADFRTQTAWRMKLRNTQSRQVGERPEDRGKVKKKKKKKRKKKPTIADDHVGPLLHFFLNTGGVDDQYAVVEERRNALGPMAQYDLDKAKKEKEKGGVGEMRRSDSRTDLLSLSPVRDKKRENDLGENAVGLDSTRKLRKELLRKMNHGAGVR